MHGIREPRHLFQAKVAHQIVDRGASPEQAVKTVESQMKTDADFKTTGAYDVPSDFLQTHYPKDREPKEKAEAALRFVAKKYQMEPAELSTRLSSGLHSAVQQASTGVPADVPKPTATGGPKPKKPPQTHGPLVTSPKDKPTPYAEWQGHYYGREAMAFLLFPGFHSRAAKDSPQYKATLDAISKGGDPLGNSTTGGRTVISTYAEYSDWAMQPPRQGVPSRPPPAQMEQALTRAYGLEGASASKVKAALAEDLKPGGVPVLMPFEVPGHQTYVSFEQHPEKPDKVVMRYYDRQRPDMAIKTKSGDTAQVKGYLGPSSERNQSTELCFEVDKNLVLKGDFVDTMMDSVKSKSDLGISPARAEMVKQLGAKSDKVYAATDSRPQIAQAGSAINCTWASFESFLSHVHGDQYKTAVAGMREFIVDKHIIGTSGGFSDQTQPAVKQGLEMALQDAPEGPAREALERALKQLTA
jgi:hypothetical protein